MATNQAGVTYSLDNNTIDTPTTLFGTSWSADMENAGL